MSNPSRAISCSTVKAGNSQNVIFDTEEQPGLQTLVLEFGGEPRLLHFDANGQPFDAEAYRETKLHLSKSRFEIGAHLNHMLQQFLFVGDDVADVRLLLSGWTP